MQIISTDKTVPSDTIEDLKELNSQSLTIQAKKERTACQFDSRNKKKGFNLMGDDIVKLHTENERLKNKIGSSDEKWLTESKAKLVKQIDDEKENEFKNV